MTEKSGFFMEAFFSIPALPTLHHIGFFFRYEWFYLAGSPMSANIPSVTFIM